MKKRIAKRSGRKKIRKARKPKISDRDLHKFASAVISRRHKRTDVIGWDYIGPKRQADD
jgi:hypothetical protein